MMILFTQSTAILHKYSNDELNVHCLLQFFPEVVQNSHNSLRIPWVFHVQRNPWVFQVFPVCGHPVFTKNTFALPSTRQPTYQHTLKTENMCKSSRDVLHEKAEGKIAWLRKKTYEIQNQLAYSALKYQVIENNLCKFIYCFWYLHFTFCCLSSEQLHKTADDRQKYYANKHGYTKHNVRANTELHWVQLKRGSWFYHLTLATINIA